MLKKYRYKAKTFEGKEAKGLVEANSKRNAATVLRGRGMVVIDMKEIGNSVSSSFLTIFQGVSRNDIVNFTRQLSTMISAGLSLIDSLQGLQEQSKPALAKVISEILNDIRGGKTLYDAMSRHPKEFSQIYLALIKSGETAGMLDKVLAKLAENLEKQRNFTSKVKSAMIYPIIVVIVMVVIAFLMMVLVVPKLVSMFKQMEIDLPLPTIILIGVSDIFAKFWWLIIIFVFGGLYGFNVWKKTPEGKKKYDEILLKIPLAGKLLIKIILADVTRTLSMLIGTGVSIIEALNIVAEASGNTVFDQAIKASAKKVEKGAPLSACLADYEVFPAIVPQMVAVGERTGKLDEVLSRIAVHFEEESEIAVKGLTAAIEPIMIIILSIGVAFLVFSIILPIYNLTSSF